MKGRPFPRITPEDAAWTAARLRSRNEIAKLRGQRATMLMYLRLRLDMDDMHGVADATADIREIDARIAALKDVR